MTANLSLLMRHLTGLGTPKQALPAPHALIAVISSAVLRGFQVLAGAVFDPVVADPRVLDATGPTFVPTHPDAERAPRYPLFWNSAR
jgi:hypothetical protein